MARISGKVDDDGRLQLLGHAIRTRRKALKVTQEALADAAGIERAHIGKIERGTRNVTVLNLLRIAAALDCQLSDVLISAGL